MKHFKLSEFDCQETGENEMNPDILAKIDMLREECGFPFVITSGYRSPNHTIEKRKTKPGTHAQGIAADIKVTNGVDRITIVSKALYLGFTGIGVDAGFIHVDTRETTPVMWAY